MDEQLISQVPLFSALPPEEVQILLQSLQPKEFAAGVTFLHEGGRDEGFYILMEGQAEVFKAIDDPAELGGPDSLGGDERLLSVINPGALIGEMSLFSEHGHHTASVRALTPVRCLEMTRADFDVLIQRQPVVAYDLVRLLSRRLERAENTTIRDLQEKNRQLTEAYLELKEAQEQLVEKEKLEHELELARDIQMSILPEVTPFMAGYDFGAVMVPAQAVGGDFYDFIPLDEDRLGIVVGDVSDKGMPAAMFMTLSYSLIRAEARRNTSPAETLNRVNRQLLDISTSGMFITVLYGILNRVTREFRFARAGHPYPIIVDEQRRQVAIAQTTGRLVGVLPDLQLVEQSITFPLGGVALIFSDGLTETMDSQGRQFEEVRSGDLLEGYMTASAQQICDSLLQDVQAFSDPERQQQDDFTIVAIRGLD